MRAISSAVITPLEFVPFPFAIVSFFRDPFVAAQHAAARASFDSSSPFGTNLLLSVGYFFFLLKFSRF